MSTPYSGDKWLKKTFKARELMAHLVHVSLVRGQRLQRGSVQIQRSPQVMGGACNVTRHRVAVIPLASAHQQRLGNSKAGRRCACIRERSLILKACPCAMPLQH